MNQSIIDNIVREIRSRLEESFPSEDENCQLAISEMEIRILNCFDKSIDYSPNQTVNPEPEVFIDLEPSNRISTGKNDYLQIQDLFNQGIKNVDYDIFLGFVPGKSRLKLQRTRNYYRHYFLNSRSKHCWLSATAALTSIACVAPVYYHTNRFMNGYTIVGNIFATISAMIIMLMMVMRFKAIKNYFQLDQAFRSSIISSILNDSLYVSFQFFFQYVYVRRCIKR